MSLVLDRDARIIVRRWVKAGYMVYMRPVPLNLIVGSAAPSEVGWVLSVEGGRQWRAQGENISDLVESLAYEVPKRLYVKPTKAWLDPTPPKKRRRRT